MVALHYPEDMTELNEDTKLEYIALTRSADDKVRQFPEKGWLNGKAADLAEFIRLLSVPQQEVEKAIMALEEGVNDASGILTETTPLTLAEITRIMGLPPSQGGKKKGKKKEIDSTEQTRGMACAIVANAMVFHERIEGRHTVPKLRKCVER